MECEESGSSLGEQDDLRGEVARATKRLKELCVHLRRGEDDSGLQSDCDESMLIVNNTAEAEVNTNNGQETPPSSVSKLSPTATYFFCPAASGFRSQSTSSHHKSSNVLGPSIAAQRSLIANRA